LLDDSAVPLISNLWIPKVVLYFHEDPMNRDKILGDFCSKFYMWSDADTCTIYNVEFERILLAYNCIVKNAEDSISC